MNNRHLVVPTTLAACLLALAASCGSDGDDSTVAQSDNAEDVNDEPTPTASAATTPTSTATSTSTSPSEATTTAAPIVTDPEPVEPPPETAATSASTTEAPDETIVVPFHIIDAGFPAGWTCDDAIPGFDVAFTNESGDRTITEARFVNSSRFPPVENPNAACAIESVDGAPVLLLTAHLDAPAAETYQLIEIRYPFANGEGDDRYITVYEMVASEEARAGLFVGDHAALDPSASADLPFPSVG